MRQTRLLMGMPITVDVSGPAASRDIENAFSWFSAVDARFSTYKEDSEISRINRGEVAEAGYSDDMREVLGIAERTKTETDGYFDITRPDGSMDPSGIVKGWAILRAARTLRQAGHENYFVDAGGDIQSEGKNEAGADWRVGIRNPFDRNQTVKVVTPRGAGIATSGTYERGQHIYDPHEPGRGIEDIKSLTVIGPDVLEADRFATAAFAMGARGIGFIEALTGFEGYMIDASGIATMTTGFTRYVAE